MPPTRRRFGRFERRLPVELTLDGEAHAGTTVNVGLGGMLVETDAAAAFDAPVRFRLVVPAPRQAVEAAGRVQWCRDVGDGRHHLGIAFEALRPADVWALLQYFNLSSGGDPEARAQAPSPLEPTET